jgi:copper transport protein
LLARRSGAVALLAAIFGIATAAPAAAHPYLLSSDPANGAILTSAPSRIDIGYTEGLDRPYCSIVLIEPDGHRIDTHQVSANQPTELSVVPDSSLTEQGTYAVNWTAVGDDGHTVIGTFGFSIGHPSANSAVQSATTSVTGSASSAGGAQRLLRTALPFATVVLVALLLLGGILASTGRRAARVRGSALAVVAALELSLAGLVISSGGWSAFGSSATGRRLIAELALTAFTVPVVIDRGRLSAGQRPSGWRRSLAVAVGLGLVIVLADSGHAASQPSSRRDLALAVYSVHLLAVSVWIGALIAVVLRMRSGSEPTSRAPDPRRSLRPLVAVSLVAVLGTGIATTDWGLRTLHDLPNTSYGKLAIALFALFVVMVWLGIAGSSLGAIDRRPRLGSVLMAGEAIVAAGALVVAGILGQIAQPLSQPYASQSYAISTGTPLSVTAVGADALDVAMLAPGIVGRNTLVVEIGQADADDFLSPASGVRSVTATASCGGCGAPDQQLTLHPTGGGAEWTTDVSLSKAASWLVTARVERTGGRSDSTRFAERVSPASLPNQVIVGVPTSLSGPTGETCRDELLGLQVAIEDLNAQAADHGDLIRIAAVDLHDGVGPAMSRLRSLGARMIALPCGTASQVLQATTAAHDAGLPVVAGAGSLSASEPGVWSTQPSWQGEGAAIGGQAIRQLATSVTAVAGDTAIDRLELAGLRSALARRNIALRVTSFPAKPLHFVAELELHRADVVALLGARTAAAPIVHAFSIASQDNGWEPSHGILASAQLMSTDFINAAGTITRVGGIEFASDINPFDPLAQYYAQRLRALAPGVRPSFDGLHGYNAGLAIAEALNEGGGDPSSSSLARLLGSRFKTFTVGSYRLGWNQAGGTSTSLAFFRSTYVDPMAMPSFTPGGASSLAHEGTFLDSGGFEQVAPFRTVS